MNPAEGPKAPRAEHPEGLKGPRDAHHPKGPKGPRDDVRFIPSFPRVLY